jgi:outer membrane immunogenic protein
MNIRHLLPALTALCALAGSSAYAADMPTKAYRPFIPAPIWSGFYAGLNGGYVWANVGDVTAGVST